ncbi:MAG: CotH kinase family protein [Alistipes sp.]|nr:CotH kinase family protein [Alistipes sp.]
MKRFVTLAAMAAMMLIVGCTHSKTDAPIIPVPDGELAVSLNVEGRAFADGDRVGLYVINYNGDAIEGIAAKGNQVDNAPFVYKGGSWSTSPAVYYRDNATKVDMIGYYPHMVVDDISNIDFAVATDQTTGYASSELMWARMRKVTPTDKAVGMILAPRTARIVLTLRRGDGWTDSEWESAAKSAVVCNTVTEARFNLVTGEVKLVENYPNDIAAYRSGDGFTAVVLPQDISASMRLFQVEVAGESYTLNTSEKLKMTAGGVYPFELRINKRGPVPDSEKLSGTVIGTRYSVDYNTGQQSETVNTKNDVFDGNYDTYFASYDRSQTWVGLDLGEPHVITKVGYSPRITQPSRVVTALIEGANKPDFSDALPLYIIKDSATERVMTYADITCSRGFRYVRYVSPNDKRCNLAELEFYGYKGAGDDSHLYQLTNLPTVVINTANAQEITSKEVEITSTVYIISQDGTNLLVDTETGVRGRGNASWNFEKKPYRLKFSQKRSPLGAPAEAKKWTLLSNHGDKTLMRNILAFEVSRRMGLAYTPFCYPVDVIVNGEYRGCYQLCDQVDVRSNRVDVTEMKTSDNSGTNLTGGYLIEIDAYASTTEKVYFYSNHGTPVTIKSPDDDKITTQQRQYIENYFNTMEASVFASNYADATNGYRKYLDLDSYLRHFIVGEFIGNTDTYWSVYMYKQRGDDRFYVGPVWDCDLAFENDYRTYPINDTNDFLYCGKSSGASEAVNQMNNRIIKNDPLAHAELVALWDEAKRNGLDAASMLEYVDETAELLEESQELNFKRWPILNQWVHMNFQALGSYEAEVGTIRTYIQQRVDKLDELINK